MNFDDVEGWTVETYFTWQVPEFPEPVLLDMACGLLKDDPATYYELDEDIFAADNDWLKKTATHTFLLIGHWFVCTSCGAAEQYCECLGRDEWLLE